MSAAEWARCKPWIEAALEYADGAFAIEDVEASIEAGDMGLLINAGCTLVFEIATFPQMKALNILFAGGDLDQIKAFDPILVDLAKGHGCTRIYLSGRLGWLRTLAPLGYGAMSATASKEV